MLIIAKPDSHRALDDFIAGAEMAELIVRGKEGSKTITARYRWFAGAPLRDGRDAVIVNRIDVTVMNERGDATYKNAFVTTLPVSRANIAEIVARARARWKVENEGFNVLKNNGYALEHNFGHGKQYLAMNFADMNMLAFAFYTVRDCIEAFWIKAREVKRARKRLFEHIRTITVYHVFSTLDDLVRSIIDARPPPENSVKPGG